MKKFALTVVAAAAAALCLVAAAGADLTGDLQGSLDDLVAWDPGFAPFAADPPPDGHEFVVGSQTDSFGTEYQHIRVSAHSLPGGVDPHVGLIEAMRDGRLEGIVLKDRRSTYRDGSRAGWTKVKDQFFDPANGSITKIEQAAGVPTASS